MGLSNLNWPSLVATCCFFAGGWAITGACPGPIYAQIGKGDWMALVSLAGALVGAYLYALLRPRLPH